jgi:pullulanase
MVYGEGWNLNTLLPEAQRATIYHSDRLPHIGHFNDIIRDTIRGSVFSAEDKGFVSGKKGLEANVKYSVTGCTLYNPYSHAQMFNLPEQSINYVSSHDNHTLWDKFEHSCPGSSVDDIKAMCKLANGMILTSQGIPFIHSGAEFCGTKNGISNSYNSTDIVNRINWNRKLEFIDVFQYCRGLIRLRKEHPAFRMNNIDELKEKLSFMNGCPENAVAFILNNYANRDSWKDIIVIYNSNKYAVTINVPAVLWNVAVDKNTAGTESLRSFNGSEISVEGISMTVIYRE